MKFLPLFSLLFLLACNRSDGIVFSNPYKTCCETPAVIDSVGAAKFYVPNVFTPAGDGINDLFNVFADGSVSHFSDVRIIDRLGIVIAERARVEAADLFLWDGTIDGDPYRGAFTYQFTAHDFMGSTKGVSGTACSVVCNAGDKREFPRDRVPQCNFGTQHNGQGGLDPDFPSFEDDDSLCTE